MKRFTLLKTMLLLCALIVGSGSAWGETATKTEGFEKQSAASSYQGTVNIESTNSDCGIAWTIYYGCVSTDAKIAGSKSAQMRYYEKQSSNYGYLTNTTPIYGLSQVDFKAQVSNTKMKMDVFYSTDGETWTKIGETHVFSNTNAENISKAVPAGGKYIKIGVSSNSDKPASGKSFKLTIDDVKFTYVTHALTISDPSNGSIIVTDDESNTIASGSQIGEGTVLNVVASGDPGFAFEGWTVTGTGSSVANASLESTTFTMGTADASLSASFVADATEYTVTCNPASHGSVAPNVASAWSGTAITLTVNPDFGYFLADINITDAGSNVVAYTKTGPNTYTFNLPASNVTVDATFDNTILDVIDNAFTGVSGTGYSTWSGKTGTSGAKYSGNTAGSYSSVQMKKASESSGIFTTVSGGYAKKVSVVWNSNTTNGRYLKVWGQNNPFTNASSMRSGTDLGTIIKGTSTELEITGNYQYIGMEGADGAIYLDEINVSWEIPTTAVVSINAACTDGKGNYYSTYSNAKAFVVPADLTVSAIGISDGKLVVTNYKEGDIVKANTGVMVSATSAGEKVINLSGETGSEISGNCLKASGDAGIDAAAMAEAAPSCKYYRLTMHNPATENKIGFWWGAPDGGAFDVAANKAYLAVPDGANARSGFNLFGDDDTTGIEAVDVNTENANVAREYYNLNGQRIANPSKGLYIVNGKKVIIK